MSEEMNTNEAPDRNDTGAQTKPAAYCRVCGRGLAKAEIRSVDGVIYCPEHAPAPVAAAPEVAPAPSPWTGPPPEAAGTSPALAFLLGLIPGVGAIYNAQYAKGLVHVVIFGLLVSILSSGAAAGFEPLFGMLLSVWIFYMAFEAYHTVKKRLRGEPVDEFSSLIPLKNAAAGSFVGPVVLIAGGVFFLLINLNVIQLYRVIPYWPVLLIVFGAYLLYARRSQSSASKDRSGGGDS